MPNFSDHTAILRDLLKVDTPFEWSEDHQHTFTLIKQLIAANIGLRYYDPTQEVSLEVDVSSKGLGAALVQGNSSVVFASKALTPTEDLCKRCQLCQELQLQQPREPLKLHEKPGCPWVKLGTDLFKIGRRNFLIISDYFSCYLIIKELKSITSAAVVIATTEIFSMFGVPRAIVSDNGPQYQGIYNQFCAEWGIQHTTTSPRYS